MLRYFFITCFLIISSATFSNIKLPRLFGDHMVLQRNKPIHIWGWASPGENVKVTLGNTTQSTKTSKAGKWEVFLIQQPAGGPHTLTITGKNTIRLNDVLIGEVWVCGGQSNMEWLLSRSANAEQEISQANYPLIRHFKVPHTTALNPQDDIKGGQWQVCDASTAGNFTAVGYFFARELYKELNVPIGLLNSTWGGTMVETWISHESFFNHPEFAALKKNMPSNYDSLLRSQQLSFENLIKDVQGSLPTAAEAASYSRTDLDDAGWKTMDLPVAWENAGLRNLDGQVWFRREVDIPAGSNPGKATLSLGPIDDIDSTFVNGIFIGSTNVYHIERVYNIPAGILKPGKNSIAVKVTDNGGGGGIKGTPAVMKLQSDGLNIPLAGKWKFRVSGIQPGTAVGPNQYPTLLYNGMIHPLINYPIAGAIWYQGESNAGRAMQYPISFHLMILDWRKQWGEEFPFYFVQLANFNSANGSNRTGGSNWAELREAQARTLRVLNTGMAVTIDIGESNDIHPRNKQDVGKRLAANALAKTYGKNIPYSGPIYRTMEIRGNKAILSFEHADNGFDIRNKYGYIHGFEIAGADQRFYYAKALAEGNKIVVFSDSVPHPIAVRYAWADDPNDLNLYNKEGFPAHPFRTDLWKAKTEGVRFGF